MKPIFFLPVILFLSSAAMAQHSKKTIDTARLASPPATAFRMHFDQLFRQNADGTYSPSRPLEINGEIVSTATRITNGRYGGVSILDNFGHDMMVDTARGLVIIHQFIK